MKKSYILTIIVVVLLCANSVMLVLMWNQRRHHTPPPARMGANMEVKDFLIKELSLTPKQTVLFDTLRNAHRRNVDSLNDKMHQLKDSLFGFLKKPVANIAVTNGIAQQIGNTGVLIDEATFNHFQKLRGLLNADQQKKFDSIIQQVLHMMAHQGPPPGSPQGSGDMRNGPQGNRADGMHRPPLHRHGMHPGPPPPPDGDDMPPGPPPGDRRHGPPPGGDIPPGN